MNEKRYTQQQIREIINRATQLQNGDLRDDTSYKTELSLQELEEIGAAVGLDISYLQAAVFEQETRPIVSYADSNATHIYEDRELRIPMSAELWHQVTDQMRHNYGSGYITSPEGSSRREWSHKSLTGVETRVSLANRGTHVRLSLAQQVGLAAPATEAVAYGGVFSALMGSLGASYFGLGTGLHLLSVVGLFVLGSMALYSLDQAWRKQKKRQLGLLADTIAQALYDHSGQVQGDPVEPVRPTAAA